MQVSSASKTEQHQAVLSSPNLKLVVKLAKTYQSYTPHRKRIHHRCHSHPAQQGSQLPACDRWRCYLQDSAV